MRRVAFAGCLPVWLFLCAGLMPGSARAQLASWSDCDLVAGTGNARKSGAVGAQLMWIQTPRGVCLDGTRIQADSAILREFDGTVWLYGNVQFNDPATVLTAPNAVFFEDGGRLQATGGARLDAIGSGSTAEAPVLRYLQIGAFRTQDTLQLSGGRTHSVLRPTRGSSGLTGLGIAGGDSTSTAVPEADPEPRAPYDVLANYQLMAGDEHFHAWEDVVITQDSLTATADSAHMDQTQQRLFLRGEATVSINARTLLGHIITAFMPEDELRDIIARQDARLVADEIEMSAHTIFLSLEDSEISRVIGVRRPVVPVTPPSDPDSAAAAGSVDPATGVAAEPPVSEVAEDPPEEEETEDLEESPNASSPEFNVTGDSIDFQIPGGVVEGMVATGSARMELLAGDSLNTVDTPDLLLKDWIEADTIRAIFGPPGTDSTGAATEPTLERLEAHGNVRALYRMPPRGSGNRPEVVADSLVTGSAVTTDSIGAAAAAADSTTGSAKGEFGVHFIAEAKSVVLFMSEGVLQRIEIEGPAHALVLEPAGGGGSGR